MALCRHCGRSLLLQQGINPHLLEDIVPELALQVGQEAGVRGHDCERAQGHLQGPGVALADGARQLDDLLHPRHALHDVLVPCLQGIMRSPP